MIYGPIVSVFPAINIIPMQRWLDNILTQGIDYNWELNQKTSKWELFFYNSPENITAFKLKFAL